MAPRKAQPVITVMCQQGHAVDLPPAGLALTWTPESVVVGVEFQCPSCGTMARVAQPPETLALLASSDVTLAAEPLPPAEMPSVISDHRRIVSFQIMLDRDGSRPRQTHRVDDPTASSGPVNGDGSR